MKQFLFIPIFLLSFAATAQSGKVVETAFRVSGNCGMCQARIETALDIKGVKFASWDKKTQMLTLAYLPKKISEDRIHDLLAIAGHDTEKAPAQPAAYEALPHCCQYKSVKAH